MSLRWILFTFILFLIPLSIFFFSSQGEIPHTLSSPLVVTPTPQKERNISVGAWVGGFWDNDTKKLDTSVLTSFEENVHKKMALTNIYSEWAYLSSPQLLTTLNTLSLNG